jgi:sodium-dependent dicarboxylate transporter 2/3/5
MTAADSAVAHPASHVPVNRNPGLRLIKAAASVLVPIAVILAPVELPDNTRAALAIAAFMIIAWATEVMEYTAAGLTGLLLFWFFKVAEPDVIFRGFVDPAVWYYFGAVLLGTIATKSGLTQAIGSFVVARVGLTYSRLLLGLVVIDFLLTFIVPSGTARVVIMAPLCITVIDLFGAGRGSNIGKGVFLLVTYASATFDKMIIA